MYCGKFDPKREVCTLKGTMTLTDYKSLFIYTHLYLQALIQVPSVPIQWNPGSFHWIPVPFHWIPVDSCGIRWNLAEWMHSCRNLWGIKKYSNSDEDEDGYAKEKEKSWVCSPISIQWNPGSFHWIPVPFHWNPADSCGILWNPAEWMHSCRNLWGIKKYSEPELISLFESISSS